VIGVADDAHEEGPHGIAVRDFKVRFAFDFHPLDINGSSGLVVTHKS
jgi:hypothetical protein